MDNIVNLESLFHRSKKRIKDLGEVFTPDKFVEEMLDLLAKGKRNFWNNDKIAFFEPCCGHGNFVSSIYQRRLDAFYKKSLASYGKQAAFYSVANSLNTLWAIDICKENISSCRTRVFVKTLLFIKDKTNSTNIFSCVEENEDFFAHVVSAIKWHIEVNETLSSLSNDNNAFENSLKTATGKRWIEEQGHTPINFELTWCDFYNECDSKGLVPLEYERAYSAIKTFCKKKKIKSSDFDYVQMALEAFVNLEEVAA